ncbi:MAG: hypothetical protein ABIK85_00950 [Candidatus Eisenbacteria bacterium]
MLAKMIADDDPHLIVELERRAIDSTRGTASRSSSPRRTAGGLLKLARVCGDARKEREAAEQARKKAKREREAAKRRKQHLESLRGKESKLWSNVHQLIGTRQPKGYDEAVSLLLDLRDLTEMQGAESTFRMKMSALHGEHARKTTLVERFRKAKLVG